MSRSMVHRLAVGYVKAVGVTFLAGLAWAAIETRRADRSPGPRSRHVTVYTE